MLWRAVASYLAFVLAAGPGLCCCTGTSFTAQAVSAVAGRPARPSTPVPSCCCPDRCSAKAVSPAGAGHHTGYSNDHHKGNQPGKHNCPCRDKDTKKIEQSSAASSVQDVARFLTLAYQPVSVEPVPASPINTAIDSGGRQSPPGHRLTAERLLDLHHLLRC